MSRRPDGRFRRLKANIVDHPRFGAALVLVSAVTVQGGQALGKIGFTVADPLAMTAMRFGFGALVLWVVFRPGLPRGRRTWLAVLSLGIALIGTNLFFYQAAARLPLGLAVIIQFLGPLAVAMIGARRKRHVLWALLAIAGVVLIGYEPTAVLSWLGIGLAAISGACFGLYVVLTARVGALTSGGAGMTWATSVAAIVTVPMGVVADPAAFVSPTALGIGVGVALLSTVIANTVELFALRRIPPRTFGVIVSAEPAIAALLGLVVLGEHLGIAQWLAIALIIGASVGATLETSDDSGSVRQPEADSAVPHPPVSDPAVPDPPVSDPPVPASGSRVPIRDTPDP